MSASSTAPCIAYKQLTPLHSPEASLSIQLSKLETTQDTQQGQSEMTSGVNDNKPVGTQTSQNLVTVICNLSNGEKDHLFFQCSGF